MAATSWENVLGPFWNALSSLRRGVLMMNLEVMLDRSSDHKHQTCDKAIASCLETVVRTTKTRLVVLSDRPLEGALHLLPPSWPQQHVVIGGWRSEKGTVVLRAGLQTKSEIVRRVARESVGIPNAYLGCDESDEDAFSSLRVGGIRILFRPRSRTTTSAIVLHSHAEILDFLVKWAESCGDHQAAGV